MNAADYLESTLPISPRVAVVLGSGLGGFADALENPSTIYYNQIPDWPGSTVVGHDGKLVAGMLQGIPVVALSGRAHLYEGYTAQQVTAPIRAMSEIGVDALVLTNAAGAINTSYRPGQFVLISDHINLMGQNPLTGPNDDMLGPRFPDMSEAYSKQYRGIARAAGEEIGLDLIEGVYAAVPGPNYETPAEIRYLRTIGADLVGMSTVLETIVAVHMDLKLLGISCVTNMAAGVANTRMDHTDVLHVGEQMRGPFVELLRRVVPRLLLTNE